VLDTPELPAVEMPYFQFRPAAGVRAFMDDWLQLGGTHHFVVNLGDHRERWRRVAEMLDLEYREI
jgi:L-arabinose isomerase